MPKHVFKKLSREFKIFVNSIIVTKLWKCYISLVFSYHSKVLFSGFFQFKGNFVDFIIKTGDKKRRFDLSEIIFRL